MNKQKYQEAEMKIIIVHEDDIIIASNISKDDDGPVELPFVPAK